MKTFLNNKKYILFIFLQSFLVSFIANPLRGYNFEWSSFAGFLVYCIYTWFAIRRYCNYLSPARIVLITLIGLSALELPVRIIDFDRTFFSLPDFLMRIAGVLCAYFCHSRQRSIQVACLSIGFLVNIFMNFGIFHPMSGWDMWMNKVNTGHFIPTISPTTLRQDFWKDAINDQRISLAEHHKGKVTLIEFWTESCGVCWSGFPRLQQLHDKYCNHPQILISSVHVAYNKANRNNVSASHMLQQKNYTFPVYSIPATSSILKELDIKSFPRFILLDTQGRVVMNGGFNLQLIEEKIAELTRDVQISD